MTAIIHNNIGKPPLAPSSTIKVKREPKPTNTKITYQPPPIYSNTPYERYASADVSGHNPSLNDLFRPHVESFNYAVTEGLSLIPADIAEQSIDVVSADKASTHQFRYWIESVQIGQPTKQNDDSIDNRLFPNEVCSQQLCINMQIEPQLRCARCLFHSCTVLLCAHRAP